MKQMLGLPVWVLGGGLRRPLGVQETSSVQIVVMVSRT